MKMVQGNSNQVVSYHDQDKSISINPSQQYHAFILSLMERMDVSAVCHQSISIDFGNVFQFEESSIHTIHVNLLSQKQCEVLDLAHDLVKLSQYDMALQLLRKNKVISRCCYGKLNV